MSQSQDEIREIYVNCYNQQLSELELLKSMYPEQENIKVTNESVLDEIDNFLQKSCEFVPHNLDYVLTINENGIKLDICVNLPNLYPEEEPDIYVRSNQLDRQQETKLNVELSNFIKSSHNKEVCIYTAISWLQDNIDNFVKVVQDGLDKTNKSFNSKNNKDIDNNFSRLWIFSHHIYNKKKREEILKRAKNLHLTGFCLPGKPGIICVEGFDSHCQDWWKDIKSMCWKKIMIKKSETYRINIEDIERQRKFHTFEEIHFQNPSSKHSKHADMSGFCKYMEDRGLSNTFNNIFGFGNEL